MKTFEQATIDVRATIGVKSSVLVLIEFIAGRLDEIKNSAEDITRFLVSLRGNANVFAAAVSENFPKNEEAAAKAAALLERQRVTAEKMVEDAKVEAKELFDKQAETAADLVEQADNAKPKTAKR